MILPLLRSFGAACSLLFFLSLAGAQVGGAASRPSESLDLEGLTKEVFRAVKLKTGVNLHGKIHVSWASPLQLSKVLTGDNQEWAGIPLDPKTLKQVQKRNRILGNQILGKYDWRNKKILIGLTNLKRQARMFHLPDLLAPETLKALLTHEAIHVVDQMRYSWVEKMKGATIQIYNAVVEGHAQAVAEKICKVEGWEKGFSTFSSVIGKIPASLSGLERQIMEVRISQTRDAYWKGRLFVLAIEKALGKPGIKRIFEQPPKSFDQVLHPEWYLHPELQPHSSFDPTPAFKAFLEGMSRKKWKARRVEGSLSQFGAALSLLPEKERKWILESIVGNRTLLVMRRKNPRMGGVIGLTFIQFKTDEDAASYLDSGLKLSRIKDRKMSKGLLRITGATYDDLRKKNKPMIYMSKDLSVRGKSLTVQNLMIARKNLVLEMLYSKVPIEKSKFLRLGQSLIQKVRFSERPGDAPQSPHKAPSSQPVKRK